MQCNWTRVTESEKNMQKGNCLRLAVPYILQKVDCKGRRQGSKTKMKHTKNTAVDYSLIKSTLLDCP